MLLIPRFLASPDFATGFAILFIIGCSVTLFALLVIGAVGVVVYRRSRGHARTAVVAAPIAACGLVVLWYVGFGFDSRELGIAIVTVPLVAAILAVLMYPMTWSFLVLTRPASSRVRAAGTMLLLAVIGTVTASGARVAEAWFDRVRAGLSGDPRAFRDLLEVTAADSAVFFQAQLWLATRDIRQWIAMNPTTPPDVLEKLARDAPSLRYWIAANRAASPDLLTAFVRSPDRRDRLVAGTAARNPATPVSVLTDSITWRDDFVRQAIAADPRISTSDVDALIQLYPDVRKNLASDKGFMDERAAPSTLRILSTDTAEFIRVRVAESRRVPPDALALLAHDPRPYIRGAVARSPRTPPDVAAELAQDTSEYVRGSLRYYRAKN